MGGVTPKAQTAQLPAESSEKPIIPTESEFGDLLVEERAGAEWLIAGSGHDGSAKSTEVLGGETPRLLTRPDDIPRPQVESPPVPVASGPRRDAPDIMGRRSSSEGLVSDRETGGEQRASRTDFRPDPEKSRKLPEAAPRLRPGPSPAAAAQIPDVSNGVHNAAKAPAEIGPVGRKSGVVASGRWERSIDTGVLPRRSIARDVSGPFPIPSAKSLDVPVPSKAADVEPTRQAAGAAIETPPEKLEPALQTPVAVSPRSRPIDGAAVSKDESRSGKGENLGASTGKSLDAEFALTAPRKGGWGSPQKPPTSDFPASAGLGPVTVRLPSNPTREYAPNPASSVPPPIGAGASVVIPKTDIGPVSMVVDAVRFERAQGPIASSEVLANPATSQGVAPTRPAPGGLVQLAGDANTSTGGIARFSQSLAFDEADAAIGRGAQPPVTPDVGDSLQRSTGRAGGDVRTPGAAAVKQPATGLEPPSPTGLQLSSDIGEPGSADPSMETVSVSAGEAPGRTSAQATAVLPHSPDLARSHSIARQIADAAAISSEGQIEVTLSPEELGRVKMTMSPGEAGLSVTFHAERAETLDLLRRHIDMLARELGEQGFGSLSFSFGHSGQRSAGDPHGGVESVAEVSRSGAVEDSATDAAARLPARPPENLDLRL